MGYTGQKISRKKRPPTGIFRGEKSDREAER